MAKSRKLEVFKREVGVRCQLVALQREEQKRPTYAWVQEGLATARAYQHSLLDQRVEILSMLERPFGCSLVAKSISSSFLLMDLDVAKTESPNSLILMVTY